MILIIGAGVTGLSAAACLSGEVMIVERDCAVGGYCQTTKRNGFVWDRAGHFFHFARDNIRHFFSVEIDQSEFVLVEKRSSIYLGELGKIDFPFQKNIHQLPKDVYVRCLVDLYNAEKENADAKTFKDFVYSTVGKSISEIFLVPYNEKLYACDLDQLDKGAMGRFFPKTNFEDVLLNAVDAENTSYNANFLYPKGGAEQFVEVLARYAEKKASIHLNTTVVGVDIDKKTAFLSDGREVVYDALLNTGPLDKFCDLANISHTGQLTANKVAVFNLGFDTKAEGLDHWIYYPGDEVFYRVGSYHNIFQEDRASLYVEMGFARHSVICESDLLERVLSDLKRVGLVTDSMRLIDKEFIVMDPAYVHISGQSEDFKNSVKEDLAKQGVLSAGRYGDWKYCSIEDNIFEAIGIAKGLSEAVVGASFENIFQ